MTTDPYATRTSLVEDACAGNAEAISEICRLYEPFIIERLERAFKLQHSDARDVAQEVLLCLSMRLPTFDYDPKQSFRGFVSGIVTRKTLEQWRRQYKANPPSELVQKMLNDQVCVDQITDVLEEHEPKIILLNLIREVRKEIKSSNSRIDPSTWSVWERRYLFCEENADIAKSLGIRTGAVYVKITRANKKIREKAQELSIPVGRIDPKKIDIADFHKDE